MFSKFSKLILKNSSIFGAGRELISGSSSSWRDKGLYFDLRASDLHLDRGEVLIGNFFPVEDVKGNQEEMGLLMVTNLRLVWICCHKKRVNISIGWRTVTIAFEQKLKDSIGGSVSGLCVLSKYETTKYEFVFTKMSAYMNFLDDHGWMDSNLLKDLEKFGSERSFPVAHLTPLYLAEPFEVVFNVWFSYKQTQLFRNCKANIPNLMSSSDETPKSGSSIADFKRLPGEETIDIYHAIQLIESKSSKFSGSLVLTNVRIIWIDSALFMKNLSIPYIRVDSIKFKQNERILIHTFDYLATSNLIEFRGLPAINSDRYSNGKSIKIIHDQMLNLWSLYKSRPKYGPECCDECINFMSYLRPISRFYSNSRGDTETIENFGPQPDKFYLVDSEGNKSLKAEDQSSVNPSSSGSRMGTDSVDNNEEELNQYSKRLSSYLNNQPIKAINNIFYSKELGLAFERPEHDLDLDRIWRIDIAGEA